MAKGGKRNGSGRKRQPTSKLKREGTYRADRHGNRNAESGGTPIMPDEVERNGKAKHLWELVINQLTEWGAGESQSESIADMCLWFAEYRTALEAGDTAAAAKSFDKYKSMVCEFGLTLASMAKMEVRAGDDRDELEAKHFGVIG